MKQTETPARIVDILNQYKDGKKAPCAFRLLRNEEWRQYSAQEYKENCNLISYALLHYGVRRGDTIAMIASSRPEWNMLDMGVMQIGGILLPLDTNLEAEAYLDILQRANVHILILENKELLKRFKLLLPQMETLKEIFTIDISNVSESFGELLECGRQHANPEQLKKRMDILAPDDVCTLVSTSGEEFTPLTHKQMMAKVAAAANQMSTHDTTTISNAPLYKLDERVKNYAYQYLGHEITCLPEGQTDANPKKSKSSGSSSRSKQMRFFNLLAFHFSF